MSDDARDALNEIAWHDFILFAWGQDAAHAAFRGATNRPQRSKRMSPLNAMIDKAVGGEEDEKYFEEFVSWVTENHWGKEFAPAGFLKHLIAERGKVS